MCVFEFDLICNTVDDSRVSVISDVLIRVAVIRELARISLLFQSVIE